MPTTVTSTIGTAGRNYSTLQAWEDACPANLVTDDKIWRGECYNDSEFASGSGTLLTIAGMTTDATRYVELTAAAGQSAFDHASVRTNPLRYDQSKGVGLRAHTSYSGHAVLDSVPNTRISRLQVKSTTTTGAAIACQTNVVHLKDVFLETTAHQRCVTESGNGSTFYNLVAFVHAISTGATTFGTIHNYYGFTAVGCTVVLSSDGAPGSSAKSNGFACASGGKIQSCAIFGFFKPTDGTFDTGNCFNNATNNASGLPGSSNLHSVSFSQTTPFVDADKDSLDLRAISGTSLIDAGVRDATNAPNDISGTARDTTPTIGAWEISSAVINSGAGAAFVGASAHGDGARLGGDIRWKSYPLAVLADRPMAYWRLGERGYNRQVMAGSPSSYWRMGEASGPLADSAGAVTGTPNGTPTYGLAGPVNDGGTAIGFNGTTDYFTFGDVFDFAGTAPFSVSFWIYVSDVDASTFRRILSNNASNGSGAQGWEVLIYPQSSGADAGKVALVRWVNNLNATDAVSPTALTLNAWNHVVVTYSGTEKRVYLNGSAGVAASDTRSLVNLSATFTVGRFPSGGSVFAGRLARMAVNPRAITQAEVSALYAASNQTDATALATAEDSSGNEHDGTYVGGPTLGASSPITDDGTAVSFDGANDYVVVTNFPDLSVLTLEAWINPSAVATDQMFFGNESTTANYFRLLNSRLFLSLVINGAQQTLSATPVLQNGQWYHAVATYDGTTMRLYLNGVEVASAVHSGSLDWSPGSTLHLGRWIVADPRYFAGSMDEFAIYDSVLTATRVSAHYAARVSAVHAEYPVLATLELLVDTSPATWLDLTSDVVNDPIRWSRGIFGSGPLDLLARPGWMTFTLDNTEDNTAKVPYLYSPAHENALTGWRHGRVVRLTLTDGTNTRVKFRGRLKTILPDPDLWGLQVVHCMAQDWLAEFAEYDAGQLDLMQDVRSDELTLALINSLPTQPCNLDVDVGLDEYEFAFDNLGGDLPKATQVAQDIMQSERGFLYLRGDDTDGETLRFENRHARAAAIPVFYFGPDQFPHEPQAVQVPSDQRHIFNDIEVLTVPRRVDPAVQELVVLDSPMEVAPGQMERIFVDYHDPDNEAEFVGAIKASGVQPVPNTDYTAFEQRDGTGTNLTGSVSIVVEFFGSRAMIDITNNHASLTAFVRGPGSDEGLRVRAKGLYRYRAVSSRSTNQDSIDEHGVRQLPSPLLMPYQGDRNIGRGVADYLASLYGGLIQSPQQVSPDTFSTEAYIAQGILLDIGDPVELYETATGVRDALCFIHGLQQEIGPDGLLRSTYWLAPGDVTNVLILDDPIHGKLDAGNVLAYA